MIHTVANSITELTGEYWQAPLPQPHTIGVGTVYPRSTASVCRGKPHTNHDSYTLAVTLGAATTLAHTSEHVITVMRWNTSLVRLFGLQSVAIDPSRLDPQGGSLRTGICPSTGMAQWLGSSFGSLKCNNVMPQVIGRSGLEWAGRRGSLPS